MWSSLHIHVCIHSHMSLLHTVPSTPVPTTHTIFSYIHCKYTHLSLFSHSQEHSGRVFRLQFDDFQIISSSHDDTILVWDFLDPVPPGPMEIEQAQQATPDTPQGSQRPVGLPTQDSLQGHDSASSPDSVASKPLLSS